MSGERGPELPYPGLRPFRTDESHLFFGREEQTDELLERLSERHFLAVVGSSGCGKSSLVRAGLLNGLETGFMASAGSRWHFATMLPGNSPMGRLAEALARPDVLGADDDPETIKPFLAATLRRGPKSLIELLANRPLPKGGNLLLLVDQFEELFRFRDEGGTDEAEAFVALLLESARAGESGEASIYVIITMRSDFLGKCAFFQGLPEAINDGQYLTPRLDRAQRVAAIRGPARVLGGDIDTELMNYLLNELGHDADQLPLMQHILARMWEVHGTHAGGSEAPILTVDDYRRTGGLSGGLAEHIQSAFADLDPKQQELAEVFFSALSERTPDGQDIRRPATVETLSEVMGVSTDDVIAIADVFRQRGRNFLTPGEGVALAPSTMLDISHESLLRQWPVMVDWLEKEAASAETYRRLAENALLWKNGHASLWRTPNLELAVAWRDERHPTATWARRYFDRVTRRGAATGVDSEETFRTALEFLAASEEKQQEEARDRLRAYRRARVVAGVMTALALALVILVLRVTTLRQAVEELSWGLAASASVESTLKRPELGLWLTLFGFEADRNKDSAAKLYEVLTLFNVPPLLTLPNEPFDPTDPSAAPVRDVAFAADGERLVATLGDSLVLWDIGGTMVQGTLMGTAHAPHVLAVGPRGIVAYGDGDGHIGVVDPKNGGETALVDPADRAFLGGDRAHGGSVTAVVFDPAGTWLATAGDEGFVKIWVQDVDSLNGSATAWRLHRRLRDGSGGVHSLAVPPSAMNASFQLASGSDSIVRLWYLDRPPVSPEAAGIFEATSHSTVVRRPDTTIKENPDLVRALAFGLRADVLLLAQGDDRGVVKVWEVEADGAHLLRKEEDISVGRLRDAAFDLNGVRLALASEDFRGYLYLDWEGPRPVESLNGHIGMATSVAFRPDGLTVATGSLDGTVRVWGTDRESPSPQRALTDTAHSAQVRGTAFDGRSNLFATASNDGRVALWEYEDSVRPRLLSRREISADTSLTARGVSVAFGNRSDLLAVASLEGDMTTIWSTEGDTLGSTPRARLMPSRHLSVDSVSKWVWDVAFSPDDHLLATASADGFARFWDTRPESDLWTDPATTVPLWEVGALGPFMTDVAFSPNFGKDSLVATSSRDHTATVWRLTANGGADAVLTVEHTLDVRSVAFSHDGSLLATGGDDKLVRVWRLGEPGKVRAVPGDELVSLAHDDVVWSVAFSPVTIAGDRLSDDEILLGSASYDGSVRLWKVEDLEEARRPVPAIQELAVPLNSDVRTRHRLGRLAFSSRSRVLLVGSWEGRAYLYDWDLDEVAGRGWSLVTSGMREEDCVEFLYTTVCPDFFREDRSNAVPRPPYTRVGELQRGGSGR